MGEKLVIFCVCVCGFINKVTGVKKKKKLAGIVSQGFMCE